MGRTKRLGKKLRPLLSWAAAAVLLAGMSRLPVDWVGLMGRTAAVSAMLMLPEGGAAVVLDRLFPAEEKEDEPAFPNALPVYEYSFMPPEEEVLPAQKEETALPQEEAVPQRESIPEEYRGTVTEVTYTAQAGDGYIPLAAGYLKNSTALSDEQVREVLAESPALRLESIDSPQVLIVHTHATEAFAPYAGDFCDLREDWRSQDNGENVVLLGEIMAQELEKAGKSDVRLVINRVDYKLFAKMKLTVDDIMDETGVSLLGLVPEDQGVPLAAAGKNSFLTKTKKGAAAACCRLARRIQGMQEPIGI